MTRQHLIIDADDTLWENNVYFERAFEEFVDCLDHSSLSPREVRDVLDEIELANARVHGYGALSFGRNLEECYRRLAERDVCDGDLAAVLALAEKILQAPLETIEGVPETLAVLSACHELTLFTKGSQEEQRMKVERSGLGVWFAHVAIVAEKDAPAYRALAASRDMRPADTWMIGNSPKSDINPALEAGLNAVFVPHANTWALEKEEIRRGPGKLLILDRFTQLLDHF